jgi:hypothetical protein
LLCGLGAEGQPKLLLLLLALLPLLTSLAAAGKVTQPVVAWVSAKLLHTQMYDAAAAAAAAAAAGKVIKPVVAWVSAKLLHHPIVQCCCCCCRQGDQARVECVSAKMLHIQMYDAAAYFAAAAGKVTKPVVAWVSGTCAKLFKSEVQFGHAGARSTGESDSAQVGCLCWGTATEPIARLAVIVCWLVDVRHTIVLQRQGAVWPHWCVRNP